MRWFVQYSRRAHRDLRNLDRSLASRVYAAIERFAQEGHGDVRRLRNRDNEWRLRVGDWRVIFTLEYEIHTITVLHITHRSRAYA